MYKSMLISYIIYKLMQNHILVKQNMAELIMSRTA